MQPFLLCQVEWDIKRQGDFNKAGEEIEIERDGEKKALAYKSVKDL